jgi:hypothetical protein
MPKKKKETEIEVFITADIGQLTETMEDARLRMDSAYRAYLECDHLWRNLTARFIVARGKLNTALQEHTTRMAEQTNKVQKTLDTPGNAE